MKKQNQLFSQREAPVIELILGWTYPFILINKQHLYVRYDNPPSPQSEEENQPFLNKIEFPGDRYATIQKIYNSKLAIYIISHKGHLYCCELTEKIRFDRTIHQTGFKRITLSNDKTAIFEKIYLHEGSIFAQTTSGRLYARGVNQYGQLGIGNNTHQQTFQEVKVQGNLKDVILGDGFTFMLTDTGLYSCGTNRFGTLAEGDEKLKARNIFQRVDQPGDPKAIRSVMTGIGSAGARASVYVLLRSGKLYACGRNHYGQLGVGDFKTKYSFQPVKLEKPIKQVFFGRNLLYVVTQDNWLYGCGDNTYQSIDYGEKKICNLKSMLLPNIEVSIKYIISDSASTAVLTEEGQLYLCGQNENLQLGNPKEFGLQPAELKGNKNALIRKIVFGVGCTYLLTESGKLYAAGDAHDGKLGIDAPIVKGNRLYQDESWVNLEGQQYSILYPIETNAFQPIILEDDKDAVIKAIYPYDDGGRSCLFVVTDKCKVYTCGTQSLNTKQLVDSEDNYFQIRLAPTKALNQFVADLAEKSEKKAQIISSINNTNTNTMRCAIM